MVILVTGANGQLGQSFRFIAPEYPQIDFIFCGTKELDITDKNQVASVLSKTKPDYCINAAAYTAVDKAESEADAAWRVNALGPKNLAESCKLYNIVLIHISTDFVFDGSKEAPYTEDDQVNPQSIYGKTKLEGEQAIREAFGRYFIIRTSWVYSQFGHNFMKTMLRLGRERDSLSVVNDQTGTPTNAVDLAGAIVKIILHHSGTGDEALFGIYNFSNEGSCSWYDFAGKIFENHKIEIDLQPIPTSAYSTPAKRPAYSVLDKSKIRKTFGIHGINWYESLRNSQAL